MSSVWTQTARLPAFAPLAGDQKTDVLIIGGGITGILCAYLLEQAGMDYMLVEGESICSGVTQNTTAKITSQHGLIYDKLIREFGVETARLYLQANQQALERYRSLAKDIDCGFQQRDSFVYSTRSRRKLEQEVEALEKLGFPARFVSELPLPIPVKGAVCFPDQAQFHPLKFLAALVEKLKIFEHTRVLELKPGQAVTNRGTITAERMIVATHFPFLNKHGSYFLKLYQSRSYVLALENAGKVDGMYVDEWDKGLSFRGYGDLLLLGGGGGRTGKPCGGWKELREFAHKHYPDAREVCHWATQDCMTLDDVAYIGQYSARTPNFYVATGFHKWGMTSAMTAAAVLCDLMQGKENPYAGVFSPSRTVLRPQLAANALESAAHLLKPTTPRCPHMGCALTYNRQEHSWDCPCHGSRFSGDGELLNNPATGGLEQGKE